MMKRLSRMAVICCFAASGFSHVAQAQDTTAALSALEDALPGTLMHNPLDMALEPGGNDTKSKVIDAPELTSGQAVSVRVRKRQDKPWDSYLRVEIEDGIQKGEEIQIFYFARTAKPANGTDTAKIVMFVGRNNEPYDNILSEDIFPGSEWTMASVTGVANADYSPGEIKVEYQLGKSAQTVEFGPIYVSNLGMK